MSDTPAQPEAFARRPLPGGLMILSAVIGFAGTVIYATALILLNHVKLRKHLPPDLRSGRLSLGLIVFVTLCYLALMTAYLSVQVPVWLGG